MEPKILVADDSAMVRHLINKFLDGEGYEVVTTSDSANVVDLIDEINPDLVISDIYLNNGDGVQLIRNAYDEKKDVPFIGMTAFPSSDLAQKAKLILKDRFFEKPFLASAIKAKVDEVLSVRIN